MVLGVALEMGAFVLPEWLPEVESHNFRLSWTLLQSALITMYPYAQTEGIRIQEICVKPLLWVPIQLWLDA